MAFPFLIVFSNLIENPYWLNGWTLSGKTCACDHDPTSFKCACCRMNGCQCPSGDSCVQCGLTYMCGEFLGLVTIYY